MLAILIFKCTEAAGVGNYSCVCEVVLTLMQDGSPYRRSDGKIEDCEQSSCLVGKKIDLFQEILPSKQFMY